MIPRYVAVDVDFSLLVQQVVFAPGIASHRRAEVKEKLGHLGLEDRIALEL
jgi:hypothetical protein